MRYVAGQIAPELLLAPELLRHCIEALLQHRNLAGTADLHPSCKVTFRDVAHRLIQLAQRVEDTSCRDPGERDCYRRGNCCYLEHALVQRRQETGCARVLLRQWHMEEVQRSGGTVGKRQRCARAEDR